jgi:HEAT repeat protein
MVGDSAAQVRLEVAKTLQALNDADALDPLLSQLAQEQDPPVKAAIAQAIAPIRDLRAVPELRKLLADPSFVAAQAGAETIGELAPLILQKQPAVAAEIAAELDKLLQQRANSPGSVPLVEAIVQAMASLDQPSLEKTFYHLLTSSQPQAVRRWAIHGLSELKDANSLDLVINSLDDTDASVRLEAVSALANVGTFENGDLLYHRMNPTEEPDSSVRDQAWQVLSTLLAAAPAQQLSTWADRFSDDPAKRVVVLKILADKQAQNHADDDLAYTRQNIGETLIKLNQPADASDYFRQALDYWSKKNEERFTAGLTRQLINALLRAHEYTDAVQFGGSLIQSDRGQQMTVGPAIRTEAERLRDTGDLQSALVLIDEAKKMQPGLDPRYAHDLDDIAADVRKKMTSQGNGGPQSSLSIKPQIAYTYAINLRAPYCC